MRLETLDIGYGRDGMIIPVSDHLLAVAWAERHSPEMQERRQRSLDWHDAHPDERMEQDEFFMLQEERERRMVKYYAWLVQEKGSPAWQEARAIHRLEASSKTYRRRRYDRARQQLEEAGYPASLLDLFPPPPPEVEKRFFPPESPKYENRQQIVLPDGTRVENDETLDGHIIYWGQPKGSNRYVKFCQTYRRHDNFAANVLELETVLGPVLIPADPDDHYYERNEAYEGDTGEYRRRCLKAAGRLISISEAAEMLGSTTSNVSNMIKRGTVQAWPDPDDRRRQLVLRSQIEERTNDQ